MKPCVGLDVTVGEAFASRLQGRSEPLLTSSVMDTDGSVVDWYREYTMHITQVHAHLHSGEFSDLIFVEVSTSDPAVSGWGECTLPGKPYAVSGAVRDAARLILGMPVDSIRRVWETAYRHSYWRGGAVETSALS